MSLQRFSICLISGCLIATIGAAAAQPIGAPIEAADDSLAVSALAPTPKGSLTLDAARSLALRFSPTLTPDRWRVRSAEALIKDAGRRPNPSLSGGVENFGGGIGAQRLETTMQLGQVFELGGKARARRGTAAAGVRQAVTQLDVTRLDVLTETDDAFLAAWVAQEHVSRLREAEHVAGEIVALAGERFHAGAAPQVERTRAELDLYALSDERRRLEAELRADRLMLAEKWGASEATFDSLLLPAPPLAPPPSTDSLLIRLESHPERRRADAALALQAARVREAHAARVPDLELSGGARRLQETGSTGLLTGVSLPLPLWSRGRGALVSAQADQRATLAEERGVTLQLQAQVRRARERLVAEVEAYGATRRLALPASRQALEQLRSGYRAGRFGYLDILLGERTVLDAEIRLIEQTSELWNARLSLERLIGGALPSESQPEEKR